MRSLKILDEDLDKNGWIWWCPPAGVCCHLQLTTGFREQLKLVIQLINLCFSCNRASYLRTWLFPCDSWDEVPSEASASPACGWSSFFWAAACIKSCWGWVLRSVLFSRGVSPAKLKLEITNSWSWLDGFPIFLVVNSLFQWMWKEGISGTLQMQRYVTGVSLPGSSIDKHPHLGDKYKSPKWTKIPQMIRYIQMVFCLQIQASKSAATQGCLAAYYKKAEPSITELRFETKKGTFAVYMIMYLIVIQEPWFPGNNIFYHEIWCSNFQAGRIFPTESNQPGTSRPSISNSIFYKPCERMWDIPRYYSPSPRNYNNFYGDCPSWSMLMILKSPVESPGLSCEGTLGYPHHSRAPNIRFESRSPIVDKSLLFRCFCLNPKSHLLVSDRHQSPLKTHIFLVYISKAQLVIFTWIPINEAASNIATCILDWYYIF